MKVVLFPLVCEVAAEREREWSGKWIIPPLSPQSSTTLFHGLRRDWSSKKCFIITTTNPFILYSIISISLKVRQIYTCSLSPQLYLSGLYHSWFYEPNSKVFSIDEISSALSKQLFRNNLAYRTENVISRATFTCTRVHMLNEIKRPSLKIGNALTSSHAHQY